MKQVLQGWNRLQEFQNSKAENFINNEIFWYDKIYYSNSIIITDFM